MARLRVSPALSDLRRGIPSPIVITDILAYTWLIKLIIGKYCVKTKVNVRYALRSIGRNRKRSALTILTVSLSVFVSIVSARYAQAVLTLWEEATCDHGTGHAQVHRKGYWENPDSVDESLTFASGNDLENDLRRDGEVLSVARRLRMEGIVSTGDKSIYFLGVGVDPSAELLVSPKVFDPSSDAGAFLSDQGKDGAVIGKGMAETLGLNIGDELTLIAQTSQGSVNGVDVRVVGIVNFPIPSLSKRILYMHIAHMQKLIRLGDRYGELSVRLKTPGSLGDWAKARAPLVEKQEGLLQTWWELEPVIRDVEKIWYTVVGVIATLLFISYGLSVLNIIYVTVAERTVEIGTLMALGAKPRHIRRMFAIEAGLIGAIGGGVGILAGNFAVLIMHIAGVPFDSPYGNNTLLVYPSLSLSLTLAVGGLAALFCVVASIPPSRKAAQIDPVTAFRGQIV